MDETKVKYYTRLVTLGFILITASLLTSLIIFLSHPEIIFADPHLTLASIFLILSTGLTIGTVFMWGFQKKLSKRLYYRLNATIEAIYRSQAIIEFNMDGTIITANDKFLNLMNYTFDEVKGKHHSLFVDDEFKHSANYQEFWEKLRRGEYILAEFKRIGKNNKKVWLQSSYNPILNEHGKPIKVIKVAADVTEQKQQRMALEQLTNQLKDIGQKILSDSNEIMTGATQLESTVSDQLTSASEQAAAVTEISTTIEEIKTTSKQTLEKAKQLGTSAEQTMKEGEKGRDSIENMNNQISILQEKMQHISSTILSLNDKTQQISEITEVVSDIAKQSKMLALNASIEAAKAGESGKGFAVVAEEVKELAERSQQSTERVQKILQDIRHTAERAVMVTEEGTKSVDDNTVQLKNTEGIIKSLGNVIEESSLASMQIVSAVREESVAMEQVDQSVKEISKVTTLFTKATEDTKKAIAHLVKISASLKDTASLYEDNDIKNRE